MLVVSHFAQYRIWLTLAAGKGLKKVQTVDKSAPQVTGSVVGAGGGGGGGGSRGGGAPRPPPASAPPPPAADSPAAQLAGMFAGGMPKLKKAGESGHGMFIFDGF